MCLGEGQLFNSLLFTFVDLKVIINYVIFLEERLCKDLNSSWDSEMAVWGMVIGYPSQSEHLVSCSTWEVKR